MKLYSLKCKSLKVYNTPFPAIDDGAAITLIRDSIKKGSEEGLIINAEDLSLFSLGAFDSKEGIKNAKPKKITDVIEIPGIADILSNVRNTIVDVFEEVVAHE